MLNNFHYGAYSYLDEWMRKDRRFHETLSNRAEASVARRCLVDVATYYGVIRTLKKEARETDRLLPVLEALQEVEIISENNVVQTVEAFANALGKTYGGFPLSAASKFLWMRFRTPVVIYDSIVSEWLSKNCGYKYDGYRNYFELWSRAYSNCKEPIQQACTDLASIKKFTLACENSDDEVSLWSASEWFQQRVFDHSILSDSNFRETTEV
jgi:hypothetical protein